MNRPLKLSSPPAHGTDVRHLQEDLNQRLKARGRRPLRVDGVYGPSTEAAVHTIGYLLGADMDTLERGATVGLQRIIHDPDSRTKTQLERARGRRNYQDKERSEKESVSDAVEWAREQIGVTERPAGSNRGPKISVWQREFGMVGQPWCGAFVGYALRHVGIPIGDFVVYTPAILAHARNGTGGLEGFYPWSKRRRGDLVLMDFRAGGASVEHVGIYDARGFTIEGNTSSGSAGDQANGGGVFRRRRDAGVIVGCARPRG